jgi:hypothetical protein
MGARQASHSYLDLSGRVRIQFGNGQRFGVVDYQQQDPDVIIEGSRAYEQMGRRIALGDFDGDMIMDFAAGAPMPLIYPGDASGRVQVILGGDDLPFHLDLSYETADAMLEGNSGGDCFGEGLAAGDVNGDGVCDLVVGAPRADTTGIVYIFYGDEQMEVEGWEDVVPGSLTLEQNFPNPFNSETVISFSLPDRNSNIGGKSELLEIIDVTGRVMALWDLSGYPPGRHQITWNGTSMSGKSCSSGIYISRLRFGNLNKEIKLIFTR